MRKVGRELHNHQQSGKYNKIYSTYVICATKTTVVLVPLTRNTNVHTMSSTFSWNVSQDIAYRICNVFCCFEAAFFWLAFCRWFRSRSHIKRTNGSSLGGRPNFELKRMGRLSRPIWPLIILDRFLLNWNLRIYFKSTISTVKVENFLPTFQQRKIYTYIKRNGKEL